MTVIRQLQMQHHFLTGGTGHHDDVPLAVGVTRQIHTNRLSMEVYKAMCAFHGRIVTGRETLRRMARKVGMGEDVRLTLPVCACAVSRGWLCLHNLASNSCHF
jgi:hypothetical protein